MNKYETIWGIKVHTKDGVKDMGMFFGTDKDAYAYIKYAEIIVKECGFDIPKHEVYWVKYYPKWENK